MKGSGFEGLEGLDDPYLPKVGELYLVGKEILNEIDVHPKRPAVVIEVPTDPNGFIEIVTRTTDLTRPGVPHAATPTEHLRHPGVFSYLRSASAVLWKRPRVEWLGELDEATLEAVLEMFS